MKVALLSFYSFDEVRGGTELFTEHLRNAFPDLTAITYSEARKGAALPNLERLNLEQPRMGLAIGRRFLELAKREDFDLVISNSIAGWYLSLHRPDVPMMNVYHYTTVGLAEQTLRHTPGYLPSRYLTPMFEGLAARGKACVAVSHKVKRELDAHYGIDATVIENGVPLDRFAPLNKHAAREILDLPPDKPIGLFVGRADRTKGFDIVEQVARARPELTVVCVTTSRAESPVLVMRPGVPNERMPLYYSAADFLLFPSRYESFGYAALEAMACDLPAVASRTGVYEDLAEDGIGRIVDGFAAEDYVNAVDEVLDAPIMHPRKVAVERFSMERFARQYWEVAEELVASGG